MNQPLSRRKVTLFAAAGLGALVLPAFAQSSAMFTKTITLVIPFAPGGSTDPVGRILGPRLARELGQPVVIENRPGAAGALGAASVARAAPDGHTIMLTTGVVAVHPSTLKNPGYDVRTDLIPVTQLCAGPYTLEVNPQLPVHTVAELIAYGKANPGKLFFGSAGTGGSLHLIGELFNKATGISMTHVPYKGGGPTVTALVGGEIQVAFDTIPGSKALSEAGKVRLLAVTSAERNKLLPGVPTMAEAGVKGLEAETWAGLFLPKGTPPAIVQRWHAAAVKVLQEDEVRARLAEIGYVVVANTPDQFRNLIETERKQWAEVTRAANVTLE
jgi:tripartite-type tricarboxylate transporter receptor subunit TctC